jgi:hypothetical protein
VIDQRMGGAGSRRCVATVTMHQDERDCPFRQQPDFAGDLHRVLKTRLGQQLGQVRFEHRLVPARDQPRRMTGQVSQLDDQPRET